MTVPASSSGNAVSIVLHSIPGLSTTPTAAAVRLTRLRDIASGQGRHVVFIGLDHQLDAELVYKKIPKADIPSTEKFFSEARSIHRSRHRHIVPIQYACEGDDDVYIAMPHFQRGSLETAVSGRLLTAREIVRLGLDFLMGLHHAHAVGVLHLDIKPANIFVDDSGAALLADFGQSQLLSTAGLAEIPELYAWSTPPEVDTGSTLTRKADVYQAGLTLYRMCIGERAWKAQLGGIKSGSAIWDQIRKGTFPARDAFPEHIPDRLRRLVRKAINPDPDKRHPSVLALMNDVAAVENGPLDWRPEELGPHNRRWTLRIDRATIEVDLQSDGSGRWKVESHRKGIKEMRLNGSCLDWSSEVVARKHVTRLLSGSGRLPK